MSSSTSSTSSSVTSTPKSVARKGGAGAGASLSVSGIAGAAPRDAWVPDFALYNTAPARDGAAATPATPKKKETKKGEDKKKEEDKEEEEEEELFGTRARAQRTVESPLPPEVASQLPTTTAILTAPWRFVRRLEPRQHARPAPEGATTPLVPRRGAPAAPPDACPGHPSADLRHYTYAETEEQDKDKDGKEDKEGKEQEEKVKPCAELLMPSRGQMSEAAQQQQQQQQGAAGAGGVPTPARPASLLSAYPVALGAPLVTPPMLAKTAFAPQGLRVRVACRGLALAAGAVEKIVCALFLYDCDAHQKVSESHTFVVPATDTQQPQPLPAACVFRLEQPRASVALVAVLYHVVGGDYDAVLEPYLRPLSGKDAARWADAVRESAARLDGHYQYLALGAAPLFPEDGVLRDTHAPLRIDNFTKVREELALLVPRLLSERERARLRLVPGHLELDVAEVAPHTPAGASVLDERLLHVVPDAGDKPKQETEEKEEGKEGEGKHKKGNSSSSKHGHKKTKDKEEEGENKDEQSATAPPAVVVEQHTFPAPEDVVVPYTEYVNILWLYPEVLNFSNCKSAQSSARNIVATVKVLDNDSDPAQEGLPVCFDSVQRQLVREAVLPVQYHTRRVHYMAGEEVKLAIPPVLRPTTHILLTFYHLDCKAPKKGRPASNRTLIGYCAVPFAHSSGFVVPELRTTVPCVSELPPAYLAPFVAGSRALRWIDGGKPLFAFHTRALSSVHPQNPVLAALFRLSPAQLREALADSSSSDSSDDEKDKGQKEQKGEDEDTAKSEEEEKDAASSASSSSSAAAAAEVAHEESGDAGHEDGARPGSAEVSPLERALRVIGNVGKASAADRIHFALYLIPKLLSLVTFEESAVSEAAFVQLVLTLDCIEREARSKAVSEPILESIAHYMLPKVTVLHATLHECLVARWLGLFKSKKTPTSIFDSTRSSTSTGTGATTATAAAATTAAAGMAPTGTKDFWELSLQYSWFLYAMVVRSMTQHVSEHQHQHRHQEQEEKEKAAPLFSKEYVDRVGELMRVVGGNVVLMLNSAAEARDVNCATAFFMSNLLDLLDRGVVYRWIYDYIARMNGSTRLDMQEQKFAALRVLFAHPRIVELNAPTKEQFAKNSDIERQLFQEHFLVGLLLREVRAALGSSEQSLRLLAVRTLLHVLQAAAQDPLAAQPPTRAHVAHMFFPFVLATVDHAPALLDAIARAQASQRDARGRPLPALAAATLRRPAHMLFVAQSQDVQEASLWTACFLHVLEQNGKLLPAWWRAEVPKRRVRFLDVLAHVATVFAYPPPDGVLAYDFVPLAEPAAPATTATTGVADDGTHQLAMSAIELSTSSTSSQGQAQAQGQTQRRPQSCEGPATHSASSSLASTASDGASGTSSPLRHSSRVCVRPGSVSPAEVKLYMEDRYSGARRLAGSSALLRPAVLRRQVHRVTYPRLWGDLPPYAAPDAALVRRMHETLAMEASMVVLETVSNFALRTESAPAPRRVGGGGGGAGAAAWGFGNTTSSSSSSSASNKRNGNGGGGATLGVAMGDESRKEELEKVFEVFVALLDKGRCSEFLGALLFSLRALLVRYRREVFCASTPYCQEVTAAVVRLAASRSAGVRGMCAATLCNMVRANHEEARNFSRMKLMSTVAVSEVLGDGDGARDAAWLRALLDAVVQQLSHTPLRAEAAALHRRLLGVISDSAQVARHAHDPEMRAELFHRISAGFMDSPDLRLTWLGNLARQHAANDNAEQAAHTKVVMAALVARYLAAVRAFPVAVADAEWARVCPGIRAECEMPRPDALLAVRDDICTGPLFSERGFARLLAEAVDLLRAGANYEQCVEADHLRLALPRATHDYAAQARIYADLQHLCEQIVAEATDTARIQPNYYRVAFYGPAFGALDGTQFVYKETAFVRIADFSARIRGQYADADPTLLPNTRAVDRAALDPAKNYIQLGAVQPFFGEQERKALLAAAGVGVGAPQQQQDEGGGGDVHNSESASKEEEEDGEESNNTSNMAYTNAVSQFVMEMPFTKSGKAQGDVADQWLKRIYFTVGGAFPFMLKRLPVTRQETRDVPPVRNAIDLIADRVLALQAELNRKTVNTKALQILLHGVLLAAVNVGPLEIGRVFLDRERRAALSPQPSAADIQELATLMRALVVKVDAALVANERNLDAEQKPLHDEFVNAFATFSETVANLCNDAL